MQEHILNLGDHELTLKTIYCTRGEHFINHNAVALYQHFHEKITFFSKVPP